MPGIVRLDSGLLQKWREASFTLNTASLNLPLGEIATCAAKHGFKGLELWSGDLGGDLSADDVRALLEVNGLTAPVLQVLRDYEGAPEGEIGDLCAQAEVLMAQMTSIGIDTLLVCSNTSPIGSGDRTRIVADLRELANMAEARDLRIAYEPLAWAKWINRYEDAVACIVEADHPALGLVIDAFHWFWAGTPVEFARQIPIDRCFDMQVCNVADMTSPAMVTARHQRRFPNDGIWPVADLVREFLACGYDQAMNIEIFNDELRKLPADTYAASAMASVRHLFDESD